MGWFRRSWSWSAVARLWTAISKRRVIVATATGVALFALILVARGGEQASSRLVVDTLPTTQASPTAGSPMTIPNLPDSMWTPLGASFTVPTSNETAAVTVTEAQAEKNALAISKNFGATGTGQAVLADVSRFGRPAKPEWVVPVKSDTGFQAPAGDAPVVSPIPGAYQAYAFVDPVTGNVDGGGF